MKKGLVLWNDGTYVTKTLGLLAQIGILTARSEEVDGILGDVIFAVRSFESGNLRSRRSGASHGEIGALGTAFNSMASTA